jgi:hypothetical protein
MPNPTPTSTITLPSGFFTPQNGSALAQEMQCYSLPFGALGFISHILTYYTIIVLSTGNSPLRPRKSLTHPIFDLWLSSIGLVGGFAISMLTVLRCRSYWQLVVIGFWKLSMAAFNGAVGIHVAIIVRRVSKTRGSKASSWSWKSYLPLRSEDDDTDTAPRENAIHGPAGTLAEPSSQYLMEETRRNREGQRIEVTEKPKTARVWIWILLCTFSDYLEYHGVLNDNFQCKISLECLRASLA